MAARKQVKEPTATEEVTSTTKEPTVKSFLRNIQNQELIWEFGMTSGRTIKGRVVDFLWTDTGIPIVILVKQLNNKAVELTWHNLQTIHEVTE